jgi:DNA-nicking Smr family endonuclease
MRPAAGRRAAPTREEIELWRAVLHDVRPLPGRSAPPPKPAPAAAAPDPVPEGEPAAPRQARRRAAPRPLALPELDWQGAPGLDKRSTERLKRGQMPIEARLDLHGMTQDEAHAALGGFLTRCEARGLRCVLVITGKGFRRLGETGGLGVLRSAVPRWLNEAPNRARVLAFSAAQPQHGGGGALYVLLRRRR